MTRWQIARKFLLLYQVLYVLLSEYGLVYNTIDFNLNTHCHSPSSFICCFSFCCFVFVLSGLNELHCQLRNYTEYLILDRFLPALNFICHVPWRVSWSELKWVFLSSAWAGRKEVKLFSNTCAWEGIFSEIRNLHI